jgi:D-aspartate ligase
MTPMECPVFVLGDGANALSVAQCLGRNGIPVHVFGKNRRCIAATSRYVISRCHVDEDNPGNLVRAVISKADALGIRPVLMCSSDHFLQLVSDNRDQLDGRFHIALPATDAVNTVLNKGQFNEFCSKNGTPVPRSWSPESEADCDDICEASPFPVIIKPVIAHNAEAEKFQKDGEFAKMILVSNGQELTRYFRELRAHGANVLVQEYIDGPDDEHYSYVSYRNSNSEEVVGAGIRKLRITPIHGGVATFVEIADDPELGRISNELLDKLSYIGISSVCFKRNCRNGKLICHELNGRFPLAQSATQLAGVNLPLVAYQDAVGIGVETTESSNRSGNWIMLDGDIFAFRDYRKAGELTFSQWLGSLRDIRICVEFSTDDLRPFFFWLKSMFARILGKSIRRRS